MSSPWGTSRGGRGQTTLSCPVMGQQTPRGGRPAILEGGGKTQTRRMGERANCPLRWPAAAGAWTPLSQIEAFQFDSLALGH